MKTLGLCTYLKSLQQYSKINPSVDMITLNYGNLVLHVPMYTLYPIYTIIGSFSSAALGRSIFKNSHDSASLSQVYKATIVKALHYILETVCMYKSGAVKSLDYRNYKNGRTKSTKIEL